jgi:hypothetical protein
MKTFKEMREARMVASADFKIGRSGRKVHKMKKVADDDYDKEDDDQDDDKKDVKEGAVPAHMQGKQKPYVSSDGKGNYEVLGNKGQTKAEFSRKEHGKDAHSKAQAHLKSKYNEYMKEESIDELTLHYNADDANNKVNANKMKAHLAKRGISADHQGGSQHRAILKVNTNNASDTAYVKNKVKGRYDVDVKEETELEEAVDKQEQRFLQLARLGLVDKSDVSKLRIAMDQLKADKPLTAQQRGLLLSVMSDLVGLVTGDDTIFQRAKMDLQKEETDPPFDKPYTTVKPNTTDKSGAQHTPMSRVRHLAKLALKKQQAKTQSK